LMPINTFCPVGCAGCYRSYYTREERGKGEELGITSETVLGQTDEFVEWLNRNPEVYDVIISGGEPLMVNNDVLKGMFKRFGGAENLKIARICTGALFQGLPFRIDEELLDNLSGFSSETGKRVTFNAHLSNHYQITPEALQAVRRIKKRGIEIYSQVPVQEGVNFFREDLDKTMFYITELGRRQAAAGIEPYKMILDMHPRTQERYVPLELLLKVWSNLGESHDYPELERPRTLSILCEQGNIILSGYALASMRKEIDKENGAVIYKIPAVYSLDMHEHAMERTFTYIEPLIKGYNDDPKSLDKARKMV
jgi:L-lysine 2,3-aminomutase